MLDYTVRFLAAAPIVEERRVRRQAKGLGESEGKWRRESTRLANQARRRIEGPFPITRRPGGIG